jgi:hypothetical protein
MHVNPSLTRSDPNFERQVRDTVPGMAHWAGTGPKGKACGDCVNLVPRGALGYGCLLYHKRMGQWLQTDIPRQTKSCKYFEARVQKPKR